MVITREGQSLYDIATQVYGSPEGIWWLIDDNGLNENTAQVLPAGTVLKTRSEYINSSALYFRQTKREIICSAQITTEEIALSVSLKNLKPETQGNDGCAFININGGKAPYSYLWSNSFTSKNLLNVQSGNYSVTVTDANEDTAVLNVTIP